MASDWFTVTRAIGLAAYSVSLLACLATLAKRRNDRTFGWIASVQFLLLLDMIFDWRWKLHEYWMRIAMDQEVYDRRRSAQLPALILLCAVLVVISFFVLHRLRHRPGAALASLGTLLSIGLWCCEAISYHAVDHVLYHRVGQAMSVSFLWCALALIVCLGAFRDASSYSSR